MYSLAHVGRATALWEWNLVPENVRKCRIPVLALERSRSIKHLVYQDTQSPPIYSTGMSASFDDFGCNVFLSTNKGVCSEVIDTRFGIDCRHVVWVVGNTAIARGHDHSGNSAGIGLLGQIKVGQHDVAGLMKKDV